MSQHDDYVRDVANRLITQLKAGTAPWQKPWGDALTGIPINAATDKPYRGMNGINLMSFGFSDPRWMTYKQAEGMDAQVRKGEKSQMIAYWKFSHEVPVKDAQGKVVRDEAGEVKKTNIPLSQPSVFFARVFHASQIDGLEAYQAPPLTWDPVEKAENLLKHSGASISHHQIDSAYYSPSNDKICLPDKSAFSDSKQYYATALHELSHWTGHESRLGRDMDHPFGTAGYAKEELRAEIASFMLTESLGVGHDPGQHAAYVGSWVKLLEDEPLEIFRACSDAQKIQDFVMELELTQQQEVTKKMVDNIASIGIQQADEKTWLKVPYAEREAAKKLGAKWDWKQKNWYTPIGTNLSKLNQWLPENQQTQLQTENTRALQSPQEELGDVLQSIGGIVSDPHPIMDGKPHRIKVDGDKNGQKSGFYVAHADGRPAGYLENHRTGETHRWCSHSEQLSPEKRCQLQAEMQNKQQARRQEQTELHSQTAKQISRTLSQQCSDIRQTPYLDKKGIDAQPGIFVDKDKTIVPLYDTAGKLWSTQTIDANGQKKLAKGGRKSGCFHVIGGQECLTNAPVIVLCEGYATACTLTEAMGFSAVSAIDANNLLPVAEQLRDKYPEKAIVIAGDDDWQKERTNGVNVGKEKAYQAAKAIKGVACFPMFLNRDAAHVLSDFNDLVQHEPSGKEKAKQQINRVVMASEKAHRLELRQAKEMSKTVSRGRDTIGIGD